jgi:predicted nucleotidyltransferase
MTELRGHGVSRLAIFGSLARGQEKPDSDVDILVEFDRPIGLFEFVSVQRYLERLIGRSVDLAMPDSLRPEMREAILAEAVYANWDVGLTNARIVQRMPEDGRGQSGLWFKSKEN